MSEHRDADRGVVRVVVGGQFGSESKGAVAAWLAQLEPRPPVVVRVAGPNAGHTTYGVLDGRPWVLRSIPVAAVTRLDARLVVCAGSELDPRVLAHEIRQLQEAGYDVVSRLVLDAQATWMLPEYGQQEQQLDMQGRLGSTSKGIGAARAARIMRTAPLVGDMVPQDPELAAWGLQVHPDTSALLGEALAGGNIVVEGTQGFGLGLHAGFYPQCTSSDCRAIDFLAMAGISPWDPRVRRVEPWVVCRTHPIRTAGNSGPLVGETSWEQLSQQSGGYVQPELTSVTRKIRRVGSWDPELVRRAVAANGGPEVCRLYLGFVDYLDPSVAGVTDPLGLTEPVLRFAAQVGRQVGRLPDAVGTGPDSRVDLRGLPPDRWLGPAAVDLPGPALDVPSSR